MENYFNAKAKAFKYSTYSVLNAKDEKLVEFANTLKTEEKLRQDAVFFFDGNIGDNCCYIENDEIIYKELGDAETIIKLSECPLIGQHNYQNIMCAIICAKLTRVNNEIIRQAIMEFKAPAHRLEKITEKDGITFYNDSKATNPEAAIVAMYSVLKEDVMAVKPIEEKIHQKLIENSEMLLTTPIIY